MIFPYLKSLLFSSAVIQNGIPRVCFYICSTEWKSEMFSLPLKCSKGNSESLLLYLFHGTEFRVVFSSAEMFGREFQEIDSIFVQRNGIPSCFLFRGRVRNGIPTCFLFRGRLRNGIPRVFCSAEQPEFRRK
jgi:hypothetical protein